MNPAPPLRTIADIQNRLDAHAGLHALLSHGESPRASRCPDRRRQDRLDPIVRPTPAFEFKIDVDRERIRAKEWAVRWPKLTMLMTWEEAYPDPHTSFDRIET